MSAESAPASFRWPLGSRAQLLHALLLAALLLAVLSLVQLWAALDEGFDTDRPSGRLFALLAVAVLLQAGGVIGFGLLRWGRTSLPALGWKSAHLLADVGFGLLGFGLLAAVVLALSLALGSSVEETVASWLHQSPGTRVLCACIGLLAAFNEESLFRGYLQPGLVARFGAAAGVLLGALVFALYHGNLAPIPLLGKGLIGLVLGGLALRRKSLVPSAVAHFLLWAVMGFA